MEPKADDKNKALMELVTGLKAAIYDTTTEGGVAAAIVVLVKNDGTTYSAKAMAEDFHEKKPGMCNNKMTALVGQLIHEVVSICALTKNDAVNALDQLLGNMLEGISKAATSKGN